MQSKTNRIIFTIIILMALMALTSVTAQTVALEDGFKNPPISARPRAYWCWVNGNFDLSRLTEELKEARDKGMGGFDIWDVAGWVDPNKVIPAGPPFMGDESVGAICHAVREATKLGLEIGLTISSSWNAGGSWVQPEDGAMGLFRSEVTVVGPENFDGHMPFPEIPEYYDERRKMILFKRPDGRPTYYKEVAILAFPLENESMIADQTQIIDLSDKLQSDGKINWSVPAGKWRLTRYVCTGTGQPLMSPSPNSNGLMIDHFSAQAMERHLQFFIEKLQAELGDFRDTALKYLYTDSYEVNSAVWTPQLPDEFKKRTGYSLIPYLPVLDGFIVVNPELTERFLFDFKKVLSDLIIENHYGLGKQICNKYGLGFHAEAGGPGPPVHNCPFEAVKSLGVLDAPRGEFWYDHPRGESHTNELQIIKGPASAAHLYHQKFVEAEAFTSVWLWQEGPNDIKAVLDKALCEGLNRFIYHTFPHIPAEAGIPGWIYNFGTLINTTRAWWPLSQAFHEYIARCCFLLQQGNFVGDVLYYYGDQAPNFVPPKQIVPSLGFGYDYDVTNSDIILNRLAVKNDQFVLSHGQRYEILVLPKQEAINPEVLAKIETFVQKGATVVGPRPQRAHSLSNYLENDQKVKTIAARLWGECDGQKVTENVYGQGKVVWGQTERQVLHARGLVPDLQVIGHENPAVIDFIHRQIDDTDIYFLRNTHDEEVDVDCIFRITDKYPQLWDPETATIESAMIYQPVKAGVRMPLYLPALGAVFVIFQPEKSAEPISSVWRNQKQLFPRQDQSRPFAMNCNQLVIWEGGTYRFEFKNGTIKQIQINEITPAFSIETNWEIRFPHGWGAPPRTTFPKLISWTESENSGIKFFSGVAKYFKTFELTTEQIEGNTVVLELGKVEEVARVYLNGKHLGIKSFPPYRFDVSEAVKAGKNYLVVEVANLLSNQLTGDAHVPAPYKRTHSNVTKGPNAWMYPWKDVPLKESGLIGPVVIKFGKRIRF